MEVHAAGRTSTPVVSAVTCLQSTSATTSHASLPGLHWVHEAHECITGRTRTSGRGISVRISLATLLMSAATARPSSISRCRVEVDALSRPRMDTTEGNLLLFLPVGSAPLLPTYSHAIRSSSFTPCNRRSGSKAPGVDRSHASDLHSSVDCDRHGGALLPPVPRCPRVRNLLEALPRRFAARRGLRTSRPGPSPLISLSYPKCSIRGGDS